MGSLGDFSLWIFVLVKHWILFLDKNPQLSEETRFLTNVDQIEGFKTLKRQFFLMIFFLPLKARDFCSTKLRNMANTYAMLFGVYAGIFPEIFFKRDFDVAIECIHC